MTQLVATKSHLSPGADATRLGPRWLAWLMAGMQYLLVAGAFVLIGLQARALGSFGSGDDSPLFSALWLLALAAVPLVGAAIAARQPRNAYGWLWLASGLSVAFVQFAQAYAIYGLKSAPGALPLADWAVLLSLVFWLIWFAIMPFLLLLFPTGHLPSRRWRPVAWVVIGTVLCALGVGWADPDLSGFAGVKNPFGVPGVLGALASLLGNLAIGVVSGAILLAVASLVVRYRHAGGVERQQLKWLAYGAVFLGLYLLADSWLTGIWNLAAGIAAFAATPTAIGIAVLRYRLYDIDVIINRTLVYALLTAIMAGLIAASMKVAERLFLGLAGSDSTPAVLFTTLVVTSTFNPVKDGTRTLVGKWLQEAPNPDKRMRAFRDQVAVRVFPVPAEDMARRFLEEAIGAFDTRIGVIYVFGRDATAAAYATREWNGEGQVTTPLASAAGAAALGEISLGPRRSGRDYGPHDREMLLEVAQAVALAIEQDRDVLRAAREREESAQTRGNEVHPFLVQRP